ncbi:MAG: OmpA family protein [Clostridiales bacterium]|nr:OmpA family protein [Clostridiales bacterium]
MAAVLAIVLASLAFGVGFSVISHLRWQRQFEQEQRDWYAGPEHPAQEWAISPYVDFSAYEIVRPIAESPTLVQFLEDWNHGWPELWHEVRNNMLDYLWMRHHETQIFVSTVADRHGIVIARSYRPDLYGDYIGDSPPVARGLAGEVSTGFNHRWSMPFITVPIHGWNGEIIGTITAIVDMDSHDAAGDTMPEDVFMGIAESIAVSMAELSHITGVHVDVFGGADSIYLTIPSDLFFYTTELDLLLSGRMKLDAIASVLTHTPLPTIVVIEVHTDNTPTGREPEGYDNLILSEQRAVAIFDYLHWEWSAGLEHHDWWVPGMGEWSPIDTNETPEGRGRNNRIEIRIYPMH